MSATIVTLLSPLSGVVVPLECVPDPVFSQKMVGDGVSIDPTSVELLAPCDGTIVHVHRACHALTIETREGIEVMVHIGLDTVDLKGEGFTLEVGEGARVSMGDRLIGFDPDHIATHAKSLLTQIVITNGERVSEFRPASGIVRGGSDVCLELLLAEESAAAERTAGASAASEAVIVPNKTGLHARPAAVLASLAKQFGSDVRLRKGDSEGNAKSVVGIMGLDVAMGDKVVVLAKGDDAEAAVKKLSAEIAAGLGDDDARPAGAPAAAEIVAEEQPPQQPPSTDPATLLGVAASPGVAVGQVFQVRHEQLDVHEDAVGSGHDERRRLDEAIDEARLQLSSLQSKLQQRADPAKAAIFAAHEELLDDPDVLDIAQSAIDKGKSAAFAWQKAYETYAAQLAKLDNELLAARANDLRDVGTRVLWLVLGVAADDTQVYPENTILVAEDLTPSDTAGLDTSRVIGFATVGGGASSHVAILARSLDIPAVAGIEPRAMDIENGTDVVLDGRRGQLRLNPSADEVERIRARQARATERREQELAHAHEPATTRDGHRIEVAANIGSVDEAHKGIEQGAEGVGLLRTEFLFLDRPSAPSEDEQAEVYGAIAEAMGPERPVIIRTLDVGGDKPLPYLPIAPEENPFLGERGIRIGMTRPGILRAQARAIYRASQRGRLRIMFPMIATLEEIREVKVVMEEERKRVGAEPVELGIMVEVPAAAVLAEQFAREVDFFSVGTNDLTQYTLAMDRGHPRLAPFCDGLNPAVLRLIDQAVKGGRQHGTWVGVCGGIASDPQAVPILIGLGVTELSLSVPAIPTIKAQIRELTLEQCREFAARALNADSAAEVRALLPEPL